MECLHPIPQGSFMKQNNLTLFPKLTYKDLKDISQGTYQMIQAPCYCQMKLSINNNSFPVNVCEVVACERYCARFLSPGAKNPLLLQFNLPSCYISRKSHTRTINTRSKSIHVLVKMGYEV